jgi:putative ABC transport system permease protein
LTHLTLATASLRRRPLRTIAAILAFTVAVGPCLIGTCVTSRMREVQAASDRPYVVVRPFLGASLPLAHAARIAAVPGVTGVEWYSYVRGDAGPERGTYGIWAASDGYLDAVPPQLVHTVDPAALPRWRATRNGALVTRDLAQLMRWQVGQSVELGTLAAPITVSIVGLLEGLTPKRVVVHYDLVNLTAKLGNRVGTFTARSGGQPPEDLVGAIDAVFKDGADRTLSRSAQGAAALWFSGSARSDFLVGQALLLLAVGVMVSAGAVAASMRERRTELAALRAIGYSRSRLAVLVLAESVVLSVVGTAIAVVPLYLRFHERGMSLGPDVLSNVTIALEPALIALLGAGLLGLACGGAVVLAQGSRLTSTDLVEAG